MDIKFFRRNFLRITGAWPEDPGKTAKEASEIAAGASATAYATLSAS